MQFSTEFTALPLNELRRQAAVLKADGWRFIQTHAVKTDAGVDLYYSFMKDGAILNYRIEGVSGDTPVPSITDLFLAAFVFENEARELFGVNMRDIALDFQGAMYAPAEAEPMTFISPEQKAAREKARKVAAAKAAKQAQAGKGAPDAQASGSKRVFVMTPELQARLDAKMPTLSDEKKAKVEAALKARAAEAAAGPAQQTQAPEQTKAPATQDALQNRADKPALPQQSEDAQLDAALALMDDKKAAQVRAALNGKPQSHGNADAPDASPSEAFLDTEVQRILATMDKDKSDSVLSALTGKGGE